MTEDLEQRIQTALDMLKPQDEGCQSCDLECNHICEGCFLRGVICDMKRQRDVLQEQRDVAIRKWCAAISIHDDFFRD